MAYVNAVRCFAVGLSLFRGGYDIPAIAMGEYALSITAPGHVPYRINLYIPSDFEYRLAVLFKKG